MFGRGIGGRVSTETRRRRIGAMVLVSVVVGRLELRMVRVVRVVWVSCVRRRICWRRVGLTSKF